MVKLIVLDVLLHVFKHTGLPLGGGVLIIAQGRKGLDGGLQLPFLAVGPGDLIVAGPDALRAVLVAVGLCEVFLRGLVAIPLQEGVARGLGGTGGGLVAQTVITVLGQGLGFVVIREALPELFHVAQSFFRVLLVVGDHAHGIETVSDLPVAVLEGLQKIERFLILSGLHQAGGLADQGLVDLIRAVPVGLQILEEGHGAVIVPGGLLPQGLLVAQVGLQIAPGAEGAQGEEEQHAEDDGRVPPGVGGRRLFGLGLWDRLDDDGRLCRGRIVPDRRGNHRDRGNRRRDYGRRGLRGLGRGRRVDQVRVHVLFQPEAVRAAAHAAQGPGGVWHAAGADPEPLLAAEIAVVPHAAGAGPLRQGLGVAVLRADGHGLKGQIAVGIGLVPDRVVGEADPLGVDLRVDGAAHGDLHQFVVAEDPAGQDGQALHGDHLQLGQPLPAGPETDDPQKDLPDRALGAVDHPGLEQTLPALQIPAELTAAHPDRALRLKQILPRRGQNLKSLIVFHRNLLKVIQKILNK